MPTGKFCSRLDDGEGRQGRAVAHALHTCEPAAPMRHVFVAAFVLNLCPN